MDRRVDTCPEVKAISQWTHRDDAGLEERGARDRRLKARGYTLIELLVVLIIIGLLSAILYPVFARAREKSRQISCASGLRQIGIGILQYSQDWDETMPVAYVYASTNTSVIQNWRDLIYPYIRHEGVFNCPSDTGLRPTYRYQYSTDRRVGTGGNTHGSYWCNATYTRSNLKNGSPIQGPCVDPALLGVFRLQKLSGLEDPSRTIWAADSSGGRRRTAFSWDLSGTLTLGITTDPTYPGRPYLLDGTKVENGIVGWHEDMANILWCDGHVKAFPPSKLVEYAGTGSKRFPRFFTVAAD